MTADEVIDETSGAIIAAFLADLVPFISKRVDDDDLVGAGRVMATALATGGKWTIQEFAVAVHAWAAQQPDGRQVMALPNVQTLRHLMTEARLVKSKRAAPPAAGGAPRGPTARPEFMAARAKVMTELGRVASPDRDLDDLSAVIPGLRKLRAPKVITRRHSQTMKGPAGVHQCGPGCPNWDDRAARDAQRKTILAKLPQARRPA